MRSLGNWSAQITKAGDESKSYPIQQFTMNGRIGDAYIAAPYGMHYNLPVKQEALNISPDGTILMGIDPVGRIKVEVGEVVFYHPVTKSKTHYKNNGDIDLKTETDGDFNANVAGDINAQCKNLNATVSEDINATCDNLNAIAATKATVTAPNIELNGNVTINGNLITTGSIDGAGIKDTVTNVTLNTHTHNSGTVPAPDVGS